MHLDKILFKPVSNTALVIFRVLFGFLITAEAWGAIMTGWVREVFIEPKYTFPFIDFEWLQPLPGNGMYYYFVLMGCFGVMVMLGYRYRLAMIAYTIMWTVVYLMQKTHYNNHYYLLMLLCFIMCFLPAHRRFSLDNKRNPEMTSDTCPYWCLLIFVIQMCIVYPYAGIAKINADWMSTDVIRMMMVAKSDFPLIGSVLQEKWMLGFITYGGIFFDLLIAPLLLWQKSRRWAFFALIFFHLFNSAVFQVGIFPYMGIALSIFFFPPEKVHQFFFRKEKLPVVNINHYTPKRAITYTIILWAVVQFLLPLRHWLYPGDVNWTEEGHRLSWRMMLRIKSGYVVFRAKDSINGVEEKIDISKYLTAKQQFLVASRPDMCWQFVQILKRDFEAQGKSQFEIYAEGKVSLNGNPSRIFYDPGYNLANAHWYRFKPSEWVLRYQ